MQFAARQRGLQQVARIHRAFRFARTDQGVHLVDEQDDLAFRALHLVEHGLEPFLELAAILRARDQAAHVERHQAAVLEAVGHVAIGDAQRKALRNRGLADARFADQRRVVLGPSREDLDRAADFLVAPDHRVQLALACRFREVAGILLHRVIGVLGPGAVRRAATAKGRDRCFQRLRRHVRGLERLPRRRRGGERQRDEHPLDRHIGIAALRRDLLGGIEYAHGIVVEAGRLLRPAARNGRDLGERLVHFGKRDRSRATRALDQPGCHALAVFQQSLEQMLGRNPLVAIADGNGLRRLQKALGAVGEFLEVHDANVLLMPKR